MSFNISRKRIAPNTGFEIVSPGSSKMPRVAVVAAVRKRRRFKSFPFKGKVARMARRTFSQPFRTGGRFKSSAEIKNVDFENVAGTQVYDTTGLVTLVNGIATGDLGSQRNGRKVTMVSIHLRGKIAPVDGTTQAVGCRTMLIYDRQTNAAALTIAQVLDTSVSANSLCWNLLDNKDRFVVLMDKYIAIGGFDTTATQTYAQSPTVSEVVFHKKFNLPVAFNTGTGATVASITTGSIYILTIGDAAAGAGCTLIWKSRVRFLDN